MNTYEEWTEFWQTHAHMVETDRQEYSTADEWAQVSRETRRK